VWGLRGWPFFSFSFIFGEISSNRGVLFFQIGKTLGVSLSYRQNGLNHLMDDHHLSNSTNLLVL
jgi:hypothetical protein